MTVDTSAVVAVLLDEDEAPAISQAMSLAPRLRMSAATYVECGVVIDAFKDPILSRRLDSFLRHSEIHIESVTEGLARTARAAYRDYGRGSGHPAKLNFGDCFSYALAKDYDEPLLCKGNDFRQTDLICVP